MSDLSVLVPLVAGDRIKQAQLGVLQLRDALEKQRAAINLQIRALGQIMAALSDEGVELAIEDNAAVTLTHDNK